MNTAHSPPRSIPSRSSSTFQRGARLSMLAAVGACLCLLAMAQPAGGLTAAWGAGPPPGAVDPTGEGDPVHLVLMIVYASVALGFSFLCSVAEAVLLSVSPSYIGLLKQEGKKTAALLEDVKSNIDKSLAAILTLNTIAHTVGAGGAGAEAAAYFGGKYVGISMAVLTLLILFLSEIIPKTIGAVFWRQLAPWTARFVKFLNFVLYPFIFVSELLTKLLTKNKHGHGFSRDEFTALADIGAAKGQLYPEESRILRNLFRFPELCVGDIMTPRTVMFALQQDLTAREALDDEKSISNFSRIPIFGDDRDDIQGFVLKDEVLLQEYRSDGQAKLADLKRELGHVGSTTPLSDLLESLLDTREHILLVVDEYGGTAGLVTLEDVVETLIGSEIVDEMDEIDDMRKLARKKWQQRMEAAGVDLSQAASEPKKPSDSA